MKSLAAIQSLFLLWLGALLFGCAQAQELVSAKVLSIEGPVEIRRAANSGAQIQPVAFRVSEELRAGDTIVTGRKGRLVLGLSDGSQAVIAAQTTIVIQDLSQSPRTLFQVLRGKTRVHIEKLGGRPNPYRVSTPTAVIAVRGTIFDVLVEANETRVFLHEGAVVVTNLRFPDQPILLTAGQTLRVRPQNQASAPDTFKPGRNDGDFKPRGDENAAGETRRTANATRGEATTEGRARSEATRNEVDSLGGARGDDGRRGAPGGNAGASSGPRGGGGSRRP